MSALIVVIGLTSLLGCHAAARALVCDWLRRALDVAGASLTMGECLTCSVLVNGCFSWAPHQEQLRSTLWGGIDVLSSLTCRRSAVTVFVRVLCSGCGGMGQVSSNVNEGSRGYFLLFRPSTLSFMEEWFFDARGRQGGVVAYD